MISPDVSVLLPVYNGEATLLAALRSVKRSRGVRWECLIVNDGSNDRTLDVAHQVMLGDARFRLINASHGGIVAALNRGIDHCLGKIIARMDADDCMHPERLFQQKTTLERGKTISAVGSIVKIFPRRNLTPGRRAYECWLNSLTTPEKIAQDRYVECPIAHPTLAIRANLLRDLRYRNCGWPEDYDLVLRLLAAGHRIENITWPPYAWRDHPTRLSRTDRTYSLDAFLRARAHFLAHVYLIGQSGYTLWGFGPTGRALRAALGAHGRWPTDIVEVHPRRIGQRIHGAPVIPVHALERAKHAPLITAVSGKIARTEIRATLRNLGWKESDDFVCAA